MDYADKIDMMDDDCDIEGFSIIEEFNTNKWINVKDELPKLSDRSVLAYFSENGGIDMVHVEDYFGYITNGLDEDNNQLYTKWYLSQGVTYWMELPEPPE